MWEYDDKKVYRHMKRQRRFGWWIDTILMLAAIGALVASLFL